MSWIAIAGKTLEFRGQLIQPRSFQDWADKQLQQNIEEIAREETNFFLNVERQKSHFGMNWSSLQTNRLSVQLFVSWPLTISPLYAKWPEYLIHPRTCSIRRHTSSLDFWSIRAIEEF